LNISWDLSSTLLKDELANSLTNNIVKSIKTSSQLKGNYAPENLIDKKYNTAWVEGKDGDGIGEWIEFEFNENVLISGISFLNGYTKSQGTFSTNNKVKSYKIDIYRNLGGSISVKRYSESSYKTRELRNRMYKDINDHNYFSMLDILLDEGYPNMSDDIDELLNEFIGMTTKIRFTITDVYKGTLYDDTCISEFLFYGLRKQ